MKLGILNGLGGKNISIDINRIKAAESMGYDSVWTAEAYGSDAVTPAAWILAHTEKIKVGTAIMQNAWAKPSVHCEHCHDPKSAFKWTIHSRSGCIWASSREGWHGVAYGRPMTRTKEYIEIMRKIFAREEPVEHQGFHYSMPYQGKTGLGLASH